MFLGRKLRTRLSLLKPDINKKVQQEQQKQKIAHDKTNSVRELAVNQPCRVRNTQNGKEEKWIPGRVVRSLGPLTYLVRVGTKTRYVHIDHLVPAQDTIPRVPVEKSSELAETIMKDFSEVPYALSAELPVQATPVPETVTKPVGGKSPRTPRHKVMTPSAVTPNMAFTQRRYPERNRRAVKRLDL